MAELPKINWISRAIESGMIKQEPRPYLGYSGVGHVCNRFVWYGFRWAFVREISPRIKRLFERGDWEEEVVLRDLRNAGMSVHSAQLEVGDITGHIKGHIDGIVEGVPKAEKTPHLLEIKTANDKYFKKFMKDGIQSTNPAYWFQIQTYMGKLGLTRCLYIITNKDNEQRLYKRIKYNEEADKEGNHKGFYILTSDVPPPQIGRKTWHECKMCSAKEICHNGAPIEKNCRTCKDGTIEDNGKWSCGGNRILSVEEQRVGCDEYELMECLK